MKRNLMILLAVLLCAVVGCAQAERSLVAQETALLAAPNAEAEVLMAYYVGTEVEVLREVDGTYVQVNVGDPGGSLMGYMAAADLAIGEIASRRVPPDIVECYTDWQPCRLYSAPDVLSGVINRGFYLEGATVLGVRAGEWLHVQSNFGGTGFVSLDEVSVERVDHRTAYTLEVTPLADELSCSAAVEEGKRRLLEDYASGANHNIGMGELTEEGLDACEVEVRVCVYVGYEHLHYEISFKDRKTQAYYAWINLDVEGMDVLSHNYGNG